MKIGLTAKDMSLLDLSMTAYWTIRFRLMRVPGVANVAMGGERIKALVVQVDPDLLRAHDVSLNQVMETTSDALDFGLLSYRTAGKTRTDGFIETRNQRLAIKHTSPGVTPEELARMPLKTGNGQSLLIGDVAKVVWDTPLPIGDAVINDGPGLMLIVEKFPWANTLDVTRGGEAALDEMRAGRFLEPLALSYGLAMLASLVVAMTLTPALGLLLLQSAPLDRREPPLTRWLQRHYEAILTRIISAPRAMFLAAAIVTLAGIAVWPLLGQSLLPAFKERDFLMHWLTKPGTSHPEMYRITQQASRELRSIPGVQNFGAHIGRAIAADEV